ncbi:MAG: DUF3842 family protein [Clostridiaceae bacterium]|nr:DUF3842 family protein [Clostridiaceae bacterium]
MKIAIVDGQGGKLGRQLVEKISASVKNAEILAIGTNSAASAAMLKGGADAVATGENALIVACRKADVIVGPVGIAIADALMGEITPAMAAAVGSSEAVRVLLPFNKCDTYIAGVGNISLSEIINDAVAKIADLSENVDKIR